MPAFARLPVSVTISLSLFSSSVSSSTVHLALAAILTRNADKHHTTSPWLARTIPHHPHTPHIHSQTHKHLPPRQPRQTRRCTETARADRVSDPETDRAEGGVQDRAAGTCEREGGQGGDQEGEVRERAGRCFVRRCNMTFLLILWVLWPLGVGSIGAAFEFLADLWVFVCSCVLHRS